MTQEDFYTVRNVLRWAGIGAMVSQARVDEALKATASLASIDARADSVCTALLNLRMGVQLSQQDCRHAEQILETVYHDVEESRETPHA